MTEQKAIADVVLNTPEPDRFVDCGESRPLPMFHMATLMQYGEQCANAALAYLRSQGEPVMWMYQREAPLRFDDVQSNDQRECKRVPLYLAPVAKVPEGWQLVPKKPTPAMTAAARINTAIPAKQAKVDVYRFMLAAAPEYKEE